MAHNPHFSYVSVFILYENGSKINKYSEPISLHIEEDSNGTSCKLRKGITLLHDIVLDISTECCKLGNHSYVFGSPHEDLLFTFSTEKDQERFHNLIQHIKQGKDTSVFTKRTDESSATQYFQFYSYLSQQQNMMQDYIRTGTYQRAILANASDFKDKVVLDVGAGSGILSFFAAQAGAKKIYAVEASSMAQHCETLVKANNFLDTIKVVTGKIEEIAIKDPIDIIISEPMGYMLYNERMLETYIHARKWLKPNGKMFPSRGDLHIAPFCDETLYFEQLNKANFWYQNCFHGVDLCQLREQALAEYLRQPIVDTFNIEVCLAKSIRHSLDFLEAKESDLYYIKIPLEFHILKSSMLHGLAFWFDVAFLGSTQTVWLSTSPTEPLTHWYQVRCLLEKPVFVKEGQLVGGTVELVANRRQSYDVKIELKVEGTDISSRNTLDLKNPYFRYTGGVVQPPPGQNTVSPSENYWQQVDVQGAKQAVNMVNGITVNGLGEVALETASSSLLNLDSVPIQITPMDTASVSLVPQRIISEEMPSPFSLANSQPIQIGNSTGMNVVQLGNSTAMNVDSGNFPVNNALMIGDYVTPGSLVLPTQGIHLGGSPMSKATSQ